MTDRVNGLFVVLDKDIRTDDVEVIIQAICMIRGVLRVDQNVSSYEDHVAYSRVRQELGEKLMEVLHPETAERIKKATLT